METVAGSILSASVDAVIKRLMSIDWLKYVGQGQVLDQLEKWKTMLSKIDAALDDAEEMQSTSRQAEIWLTDLKRLAYDLEDVVDQLATKVQQHILKDQDDHNVRPSNIRKLLSSCCAAVKPATIMLNKEMHSKVDEISARLDQIIREKDYLKLGESNRKKRVIQGCERPLVTSVVNEEKVYGREDDKKAVLNLLEAADADSDANFAVVPIIGMGGLGKTTLAQLIYSDTSLEFDLKAWVSVGTEDLDVSKVTRTILQYGEDNEDLNSLQVKLKQKLSGKRFLIILDDVWSENYDDWTLLCGPLEAGAPKSRIIITTRSDEVSRMAGGTRTAYHLKVLPYDESLSVFCQHALGATDFGRHLHLKATGEEIVKRCKGLPLAAKALGGILKGKSDISDISAWEKVVKSEIWEGKSNILPALRLSYVYLPPHLKRCFAYCSIFPKDHEFDKNELILLWMAEGFLGQPNQAKDAVDIGREYFDELLKRSFFQQSSDNKSTYVMHDLIHDLALSVSREICFHLGENNKSAGGESHEYVRHSAFMAREYNLYARFECFHKMVKLRTFLSLVPSKYDERHLHRRVLYDLLPKLKCLRVLSLTNFDIEELPSIVGELKQLRFLDLSYTFIRKLPESMGNLINLETLKLHNCRDLIELPKSICNLINLLYLDISWTENLVEMPSIVGELKQLRYLDLSCTDIRRLPESIGNLVNLETLKLHNCRDLIELPKSICNLINLLYLDISGTCSLKEMPPKIGNLTSLRMLSVFIVGEGNNGLKISELKKLSQLAGKLEIEGLQNVGAIMDGNFVYLKEKPGLLELDLDWGYPTGHNGIQDEQILKSLEPHQNISSVSVTRFGGSRFPSWIGDPIFTKMVKLRLVDCKNIKWLPLLGRLTSLKELKIEGLSGVEEVGSEFYEDDSSFPCLEFLEIEDMPEWKQWSWPSDPNGDSVGKIHKLRVLRIKNCPKLAGKLPSLLPSLEELGISGCYKLTDLPRELPSLKTLHIRKCEGAVLRSLTDVPCLTELIIYEMKGLSIFDESCLQAMTALQKFEIKSCEELKYLWADGTNVGCLTSLKHLVITSCNELVSLVNGEEGPLPFNLEYLRLADCNRLKEFLNGPNSLKNLEIDGCPSLEVHCNSEMTTYLQRLSVSGNSQFVELVYNGFSHLRELAIWGCNELESFPGREFPIIPTLTKLSICYCRRLKSLSNHMESFPRLQSLAIYSCDELESFPDTGLPNLSLMSFYIRSCPKLKSLPNHMVDLTSLQYLSINDTKISSLERCMPPNLTKLEISDCEILNRPITEWGLHTLTSLQSLRLGVNREMVSFPDKDGLLLPTSLTFLGICRFENLESISRALQNLTSLRELSIVRCHKVKSFPIESLPPALEYLYICECHHLKEWCSNDKGEYGPIVRYDQIWK